MTSLAHVNDAYSIAIILPANQLTAVGDPQRGDGRHVAIATVAELGLNAEAVLAVGIESLDGVRVVRRRDLLLLPLAQRRVESRRVVDLVAGDVVIVRRTPLHLDTVRRHALDLHIRRRFGCCSEKDENETDNIIEVS